MKINYGVSLEQLAGRLKVLRQELGLSQEEMAEKVGLNIRYWQKLEGGQVNVGLENLNKIANGLKIPLVMLLGQDDEIEKGRSKGK